MSYVPISEILPGVLAEIMAKQIRLHPSDEPMIRRILAQSEVGRLALEQLDELQQAAQ